MNYQTLAKYSHSYGDSEAVFNATRTEEKKETKYFVTEEHEIKYRFYLHQHPYLRQLLQKLLRDGTSGLQAADTVYLPGEMSIAGSVRVGLAAGIGIVIPEKSKGALVSEIRIMVAGVPLELAPNLEFKLAAAVQATLTDGMKATLVQGLTNTPPQGTVGPLPANTKAIVFADTKIAFAAQADITLQDGSQVAIPAGTEVLLAAGSQLVLSNVQVTFLKSLPRPELYADFFGPQDANPGYEPNEVLLTRPYPVEDLDFSSGGAYAVYNWELFFHVPLTVALHLSKNQRFGDAQRWFHYVFDPTDDSDGPTPQRFWKVRPFQYTDVKKLEEILVNLTTDADPELRKETICTINAWKEAPFRPHIIARYRQQAYMYKTVMAYLDNLIAWGDSLFRQDTGEAIDEALMLYVLAANILGPRPQAVPKKGSVRPQTYFNLQQDLKQFGIVMRDVEADLPFDLIPLSGNGAGGNDRIATLRSLGKALYFCVPPNDKLLSYWDTVADRLFKIRNSLNLQGIFRQLALFEPPIDPAMLARAAAAGLDVATIVNGLNQPLPLVRFQLLAQKAAEICQEVKALGNNLLSAMEKEDGEALAVLRTKHERLVMEMVEHVKYMQFQEAVKSKEALMQTLALAVQRYTYYERQLGRKADEIQKSIPELGELDKDSLDKMKVTIQEPSLALREIDVDIATDASAQAAGALNGGKVLSSHEARESLLLEGAQLSSDIANVVNTISSAIHVIPEFKIHGQPMGVGGTAETGGSHFGWGLAATANAAKALSERLNFEARRAARIDGFARREREWAFQSSLAAGEITQIFKQIRAAEIRQAVAEQELKNHRQQMKNAEEIERFLNEEGIEKNGKTTNKALYTWMKREVKGLYSQCFQFAFDIARKAERALQHELGNAELTFLQFGYLAGKEGLLAGDKLYLDIKHMEMAYHDLNQREYELTKHISLLQLDPLALMQLRATGRCTVRVPESLFDMDGPGHYFRRIKNVALSVPCVTGPYGSVNCTLTLLKSSIRKSSLLRNSLYAREDAEDDRFDDYFGSLQSIVTSSAQNDGGLFETNLHDERFLPFEYAGVIGEWQLELPANPSNKDLHQFDYDTISDVILHLRYTAREGGSQLRKAAIENLKEEIKAAQVLGSVRLFSVRHEFPSEWAKFVSQPQGTKRSELALKFLAEHYPFWSKGRLNNVVRICAVAQNPDDAGPATLDIFVSADKNDKTKAGTLTKDARLGTLVQGQLAEGVLAKPEGELKLYFETPSLADVWIAVTWAE